MLKTALKKFGRTRAAAVAVLAVGAIGAMQLPKHRVDNSMDRSGASTGVLTDSDQMVVFGTNNLLGGSNADVEGAARAAELSQDHLVSCMSLSQAGESPLLNELQGLTQSSRESTLAVAGTAGTSMVSATVTAAVPEPAAEGLLAAMVVPALLRRRRSVV